LYAYFSVFALLCDVLLFCIVMHYILLIIRDTDVFRVCLFVCLFVCLCVRTYHVRNIYIIRYYATAVYSSF